MPLALAAATLAAAAAAANAADATAATPPVVVGAIRWDANFDAPGMESFEDSNHGIVARATTYDLSVARWHYRVPFFGEELNETAIVANGNSADVMGRELDYASKAGIKFWSFCNYPIGCKDMHPPAADCEKIQCCADNVGLSYAWNQYLAHPDNHKVNFTLLLQPGYWFPTALKGGNETLEQEVSRYASYFQMPNYQKVAGGRPLVFLFGGKANASDLEALRNACKKALGVLPFIASMSGQELPQIDAVSRYVTGGGTTSGAAYAETIAGPEAKQWDSWAAAGKQVIPTVSAGWDPRPRVTYPCTYGSAENCSCPWGGAGGERYVVDPTMEELTAHTTAGLDWVAKNNGEGGAAEEASAMLLSAWNEHDEGHWIQPALGQYGSTEKLDANKKAISAAKEILAAHGNQY